MCLRLRRRQQIIERLLQAGETWAARGAQDDDVTFVVFKVITELP